MTTGTFPELSAGSNRIALVDGGRQHTYQDVDARTTRFANGLLSGAADLEEERIAFVIPAGLDYVTAMQGVWRAGGIAVPLNVASAEAELEHYLSNAGVTRLVASPEYRDSLQGLCDRLEVDLYSVNDVLGDRDAVLPEIASPRRAMILFTSGTTNKPKGVVITHKMISAQVSTLIDAWRWKSSDTIPLFLPLHHIHGIVNVLCCALSAGATVHVTPKLDLTALCDEVAANTYTVFMAVPTIYVKLIDHIESLNSDAQRAVCAGFAAMRLNVSGSAACPVRVFEQWQALTGQVLLERYGMTEVGMAISNPYESERRAGYVGQALPGVKVSLFDDDDGLVSDEATPGEIRMQGDNVFSEYWGNPEATENSFVDGWFCSGDIAVIEDGYFRIMGRSSIDIIKSGGYKLSALEIEGVLLTHESIAEVAVVGAPDETWGEAVVAVIGLCDGAKLDYFDLKNWCGSRMSAYKIPKHIKIVDALPRNAMGKVTKTELRE